MKSWLRVLSLTCILILSVSTPFVYAQTATLTIDEVEATPGTSV